jgi:plasmid stabilization system protein ParE
MAQVIWAEPALNDLDTIADYIALDNPAAASQLVQRIFVHVDQTDYSSGQWAPDRANYVAAATAK